MIEMTEMGKSTDTAEFDQIDPALFSPDHRHFAVLTRRGDLAANANTSTLLLYTSDEVGRE